MTSRSYNGTTATLSYDGLDHLTMYNAGSIGQEQYVYDASGERVLRRSTSGSTTNMTVYAFGLEEHRYSGSGINQGNTYYYILGGMLVGEFDGTNTNMFLTDALGSVLETISATPNSAAVQGNQVYSPYGSSRYQQGNMGTAKGFTGQYNDSLSGLDYYNARYYDPVVGRFLSADPVESNLQGLDPYAYVQDNPETHNDPSGHLGGGPGQNKIYAELARLRKNDPNDPNFLKVLELLWMVVDLFTGIKSIIHDIQTLLNAQASGTDKLLALGDLTVNVVLDALMFTGVGEVGRGGKLLVSVGRGVLDVIKGIVTGEDVGRAVDDVLHQAEDLVHGACSFTSATRVTTDHGKQAIGTLHVGERVLAYNPKTHKMELEPIVHVWINHDHDLVNLTITTMATKGQHGRVTTPTSDIIWK